MSGFTKQLTRLSRLPQASCARHCCRGGGADSFCRSRSSLGHRRCPRSARATPAAHHSLPLPMPYLGNQNPTPTRGQLAWFSHLCGSAVCAASATSPERPTGCPLVLPSSALEPVTLPPSVSTIRLHRPAFTASTGYVGRHSRRGLSMAPATLPCQPGATLQNPGTAQRVQATSQEIHCSRISSRPHPPHGSSQGNQVETTSTNSLGPPHRTALRVTSDRDSPLALIGWSCRSGPTKRTRSRREFLGRSDVLPAHGLCVAPMRTTLLSPFHVKH